jgi:2-amino-4-hydroxy-6-hydroxymethyldihydropteridine diphosphokinase
VPVDVGQRPVPVAISLGSNLGDRDAALAFALERLHGVLANLRISEIHETTPQGEGLDSQPLYLNAIVIGDTALAPRELLEALLAIEKGFGRERPWPNAPRTLDLDLVLFGERTIDEPGLQVPHPRFRERFFVLGPLAEVAPAWVDPVTGRTVAELLRALLRNGDR